jgi:hypothetical protein
LCDSLTRQLVIYVASYGVGTGRIICSFASLLIALGRQMLFVAFATKGVQASLKSLPKNQFLHAAGATPLVEMKSWSTRKNMHGPGQASDKVNAKN